MDVRRMLVLSKIVPLPMSMDLVTQPAHFGRLLTLATLLQPNAIDDENNYQYRVVASRRSGAHRARTTRAAREPEFQLRTCSASGT